jgi:hypothetical protein
MRTKKFWISMLLLLLLPFWPVDAQHEPKKQPDPGDILVRHAEDGRRRYLQWYTLTSSLH